MRGTHHSPAQIDLQRTGTQHKYDTNMQAPASPSPLTITIITRWKQREDCQQDCEKKKTNCTPLEELKQVVVDSYLSPTLRYNGHKPTLNELYSITFNYVDRFNRYLSLIGYTAQFTSEKMRILVGLIEICIVNS